MQSAEILEMPDHVRADAGLYSLADLPQRGSVAKQAFGAGWPELDEIFKILPRASSSSSPASPDTASRR
jgi:hypothetical protein